MKEIALGLSRRVRLGLTWISKCNEYQVEKLRFDTPPSPRLRNEALRHESLDAKRSKTFLKLRHESLYQLHRFYMKWLYMHAPDLMPSLSYVEFRA